VSVGLPWGRQFVDPRTIVELIAVAQSVARPQMRILDVGSGAGQATTWLGSIATMTGGTVDCVDVWDDPEAWRLFQTNILRTIGDSVVRPHRGRSESVIPALPPVLYDLIFIDADHRYAAVRRDIQNTWPRVRPGGVLCGHDYEAPLAAGAEHLADVLEVDTAIGLDVDGNRRIVHPGVIAAVQELLPNHTARWNIWRAFKETPGGDTDDGGY